MQFFVQTNDEGVVHSILQGKGFENVANTYSVDSFNTSYIGMKIVNGKLIPNLQESSETK